MFEGETTITFDREAAEVMLSGVLSKLFDMPIEVSSVNSDYRGLCVTFARQGYKEEQKKLREAREEQNASEPNETS